MNVHHLLWHRLAFAPVSTGTLTGFGGPAINQSGMMVTQADISGVPTVTNGIFTCQNGSVRAISLEDDLKPGGAVGERFSDNQSDPSISDNGLVAFVDFGTTAGVFISAISQPAIPALNYGAMAFLTAALLIAGTIALRRR